MTPADLCRKNGWEPGTLLRGTEYGTRYTHGKIDPERYENTDTIQITAVGLERILARRLIGDGEWSDEGGWTLDLRKWARIGREPVT